MTLKTPSDDASKLAKEEPPADDDPGSENAEQFEAEDLTDETGKQGLIERIKNLLPFRRNPSLRQDLEVVLGQEDDDDLTFSPQERAMLSNILSMREVRADDVMVPRADIDGVDATITLGELMFLFEESSHSRMPVYKEMLDDPIGLVHVKDLMTYIMDQAEKNPKDDKGKRRNDVVDYDLSNVDLSKSIEKAGILRPILFVPPSMPAFDIFTKMQATRSQMALVIDEYGGTDGLVSMEDVVEAIVGDIEDEHDDEAGSLIVKEADNRWSADARTPLEDLCEALGIPFDIDVDDDDVDTIGGLLFTELGRVPVRGEVVRALGTYDFHIIEADPRRIKKIRIVAAKQTNKRRRKRDAEASTASDASTKGKSKS